MKEHTYIYSRNIGINYLFTLIFNLDLTRGLWMIYLAGRGFTLMQLGILKSVFHITSFLMEVPTGAVADLWGRKASRSWGRVCFLISLVIMFYSGQYVMQLIGFIFCAVGYNLESGAGEALVYDSLLFDRRKQEYMQIRGRTELVYQAAAIAAYLIGGYLAVRSYPAVFQISMVICVGSFIVSLFFKEPSSGTDEAGTPAAPRKGVLESMKRQTAQSLRIMKERPRIAFLILFSETIFTFMTCLFFYLQNFWKSGGRDELFIGVIFSISAVVAGLTGWKAKAVEQRIGERNLLLFTPLLLILCLWGVALSPYEHIFFIATGIIEGLLIVAISEYINAMIPSANRATILSFQSMAFSMIMIVFFPLVGWMGDTFSLTSAFIFMAAAASLMYFVYILLSRRILLRHCESE